jgi:chitinase
MVAGAWYAGWHGGPYDFPPGDVSYDKYTTLAYAFAETTADPSVLSLQASDQEVLPKVVDYAHQAVRPFSNSVWEVC